MIGILLCVEVVTVLYALCMSCVSVSISNSICISFVSYGFMLILLQSLLYVVLCSVLCVCLAILYGCIDSYRGRWFEDRSSIVSMVYWLRKSMV